MAPPGPHRLEQQLSRMTIHQPNEPILRFESIEHFAAIHNEATLLEFAEEQSVITSFNNGGHEFSAFIISAPPRGFEKMGWVVRVATNCFRHRSGCDARGLLPNIGEKCQIRFRDGKVYDAERTQERIPLSKEWDRHIEFKVDIGKSTASTTSWMPRSGPLTETVASVANLLPHDRYACRAAFTLHVSRTTTEAELAALERLVSMEEENETRRDSRYQVFQRLILGAPPSARVWDDLAKDIPQVADLSRIPDEKVRRELKRLLAKFDHDQQAAFDELRHIPDRVFWLPGGPGAGKTTWALRVAALAMAGEKKIRILYLLDINKPLTDTAKKMVKLARSLGLKKKIIRLYKWPTELTRTNQKVPEGESKAESTLQHLFQNLTPTDPDFKEQFWGEWNRQQSFNSNVPEEDHVQSLDEAACDHFRTYQDRYPRIQRWLEYLDHLKKRRAMGKSEDGNDTQATIYQGAPRDIQNQLTRLYQDVLKEADFVAATPVAARRLADGIFDPQLVFFDEAGHARELSTLISVAFFRPYVWLFTGDYRQTQPFVRTREAVQLTMSMMERKGTTGGIRRQLLLNHRAHGGLEEMASEMMYGGNMRSAIPSGQNFGERVPPPTRHLQMLLAIERKRHPKHVTEGDLNSRLLINVPDSRWEEVAGSFHNPRHQAQVEVWVEQLLRDKRFKTTDGTKPGTILIIVPYRAAFAMYTNYVSSLIPEEARRVEVRTMGTVQGDEADVVFLDIVKTSATDFLDDKHRLCVSITRARQAEIILMSKGVAQWKFDRNSRSPSVWLKGIWDYCEERNLIQVFRYDGPPKPQQADEPPRNVPTNLRDYNPWVDGPSEPQQTDEPPRNFPTNLRDDHRWLTGADGGPDGQSGRVVRWDSQQADEPPRNGSTNLRDDHQWVDGPSEQQQTDEPPRNFPTNLRDDHRWFTGADGGADESADGAANEESGGQSGRVVYWETEW